MTTSCFHHDAESDSATAQQFAVVKRSVMVGGHKTSVSLEDAFWDSLKEIATRHGVTLAAQLTSIDTQRKTDNLSSAIRLFVLEYFRTRAISLVMIGESRPNAPAAVPQPRLDAVAWR